MKHERSLEKTWLYILIAVCIASAGVITAGLLGQWLITGAGIALAVFDLGVFVWALASLKHPWSSFRSGLLSLIIALVTLLVGLAA